MEVGGMDLEMHKIHEIRPMIRWWWPWLFFYELWCSLLWRFMMACMSSFNGDMEVDGSRNAQNPRNSANNPHSPIVVGQIFLLQEICKVLDGMWSSFAGNIGYAYSYVGYIGYAHSFVGCAKRLMMKELMVVMMAMMSFWELFRKGRECPRKKTKT